MADFRESSRKRWTSAGVIEHINAGSLQRIADATELMARRHLDLIRERDEYERRYKAAVERERALERKISAPTGADALREALWICVEHNALHFGETHNTVVQGRAALASAAPQPAVQQGDAEGLLIAAVDEWFAKNTGLGGCSDGDVRELRRIFAAHPAAPAPAALAGPSTEQQAAVFREYLNVHEVGGSIGGHAMDAMALDLARIVDALRSRARTNASGQRGEDVAQFVTAARAAKEDA